MSESSEVRTGSAAIAGALRAAAMLIADRAQQWLLLLVALRACCEERSWLRLPFYVALHNADLAAVRRLLLLLLPARAIMVQAWTGFPSTHQASARIRIHDLSRSPEWLLYMARQGAFERSLPYGAVRNRPGNHIPVYGDTINVVPIEFVPEALAWGHVISIEGGELVDIAAMEAAANGWHVYAQFLAPLVMEQALLRPDAVPYYAACSRYLHRGFVLDAAIAEILERISGATGLSEAVLKSWEAAVRHAVRTATPRQKDAVILKYVHDFVGANEPDRGEVFREDRLAKYVREKDPELFAGFDATALGKVLSRRGIGQVSRHGFVTAKDVIDPPRVFRNAVRFSDDDLKLMEAFANELPD